MFEHFGFNKFIIRADIRPCMCSGQPCTRLPWTALLPQRHGRFECLACLVEECSKEKFLPLSPESGIAWSG